MPQIESVTQESLARAAALLAAGDIVAVPTETVYGLAADARNGEAVARIYAAKSRPAFNPLIAHVEGKAMARDHAEVGALAEKLMAAFWPGPLTLVLPALSGSAIASIVRAGLPTVALRAPAHPAMRALIVLVGGPLAAPSANASGRISPTRAEHVAASLGDAVPLILDGGASVVGIESTIVSVEDGAMRLLRPGGVTEAMLSDFAPITRGEGGIKAPGQLAGHYAPSKPLRLNAETAEANEVHIGFGSVAGDFSLSETGSLTKAAAALFAMLHRADGTAETAIAVAPIPDDGLGRGDQRPAAACRLSGGGMKQRRSSLKTSSGRRCVFACIRQLYGPAAGTFTSTGDQPRPSLPSPAGR